MIPGFFYLHFHCKGLWAALAGAGVFLPLTWQWAFAILIHQFVLSRTWRTASVLCWLLVYLLRFSAYILVNLTVSHLRRMGLRGASSVHPPGHGDAVTALGMSTPPEGLQCRVPLAGVGPHWPITRQWLRKEPNRAVLSASCQPSQTRGASCTTHFIALGIHSYWDIADVSLQWCRRAFTLVPGPGVHGWARAPQRNAPTRNGFPASALKFPLPL